MHQTIQLAILGVATGCLYALMGSGLILIYRASNILNLAHGAIATFGTFTFLHAVNSWDWPTVPAALVGISGSVVIGCLFQVLILRQLRASPPLARVVATLGLLVAINAAIIPIFQVERPRTVRFISTDLLRLPFGSPRFTVPWDRLVLSVLTVILLGALYGLYRYTRFGYATRAAADNQRAASLAGISPNRIELLNWGLGAAMAAVAGILLSSVSQPDPLSFTLVMLAALAAVLIARFHSFTIMLAGGVALGVAQAVLLRYSPDLKEWTSLDGWGQALPFLLVIAAVVMSGRSVALKGAFDERPLPQASVSQRPWRNAATALIVGLGLVLFVPKAMLAPLAVTLVGVVLALSVVIITGYAGQISLVQMGLAGLGAWATARFSFDVGLPFPLPLLMAGLIAVPVGFLVGLPALRVRGMQLAIVTLGAGIVLDVMFFSNRELTGADGGLPVDPPRLGSFDLNFIAYPRRYAAALLIIAILVALAVHFLRASRLGSQMLACRSNERGAASVGLSVTRTKLAAFSIAAFVAGVAGGLHAYMTTRVAWSGFDFTSSIFLVSVVYIGGIATIGGATTAGIMTHFGLIAYYFQFEGTAARVYEIIGGLAVMIVVVLHPEGFGAVPKQLAGALTRRLRRDGGTEVDEREAERPQLTLASEAVAVGNSSRGR